jgi:hypothetical protein
VSVELCFGFLVGGAPRMRAALARENKKTRLCVGARVVLGFGVQREGGPRSDWRLSLGLLEWRSVLGLKASLERTQCNLGKNPIRRLSQVLIWFWGQVGVGVQGWFWG